MKRIFSYTSLVHSIAINFRKRRFQLFKNLLSKLSKPVTILDVGGEESYWNQVGLIKDNNVRVTLLNLYKSDIMYLNFDSVAGDARRMPGFSEKQFDVVFSNAVIEHVGDYNDQMQMANEIQRVGKSYFIQTPNRYFPIEPHYLFPFFQFLPMSMKAFFLRRVSLDWTPKISNKEDAEKHFRSYPIRLMTKKELMQLFPGAKIYKEKVFGLTKAFIVYKGFEKI